MALLLGVVGIYGVIRSRCRSGRARSASAWRSARSQASSNGCSCARPGAGGSRDSRGLAGLALSRVIRSLLFGITALDATTYAAMSLVMAGAAALASYLPARRAAAMDPSVALRAE